MDGRVLSNIDEYALISGIEDPQHRLLFLLFLRTGMTVHEVSLLRVAQFDVEKKTVTIPKEHAKNRQKRILPLQDDLFLAAYEFIRSENLTKQSYLFFTRESPRMTERRIQQIVAYHTKKILGRSCDTRIFRQSYIVRAFKENIPLSVIEKNIGVKSVQQYIYRYFKARDYG